MIRPTVGGHRDGVAALVVTAKDLDAVDALLAKLAEGDFDGPGGHGLASSPLNSSCAGATSRMPEAIYSRMICLPS
jgi:hypothetical protein